LFDIKCAWFNEEQYYEFFPRSLIARQHGSFEPEPEPESEPPAGVAPPTNGRGDGKQED
jgi:hypothetical protein